MKSNFKRHLLILKRNPDSEFLVLKMAIQTQLPKAEKIQLLAPSCFSKAKNKPKARNNELKQKPQTNIKLTPPTPLFPNLKRVLLTQILRSMN